MLILFSRSIKFGRLALKWLVSVNGLLVVNMVMVLITVVVLMVVMVVDMVVNMVVDERG